MTNGELLEMLEKEMSDDDELDEEARLIDILDWLACIGVPGADEAYTTELNA